jgi:hypothetical protein
MPSRNLLRRLIPLIAATGLLVFTAAPASAAASSTTETVHGVTESFPEVNPCTGDPGIVTVTYNGVFHTSIDATGGTHLTGTLTGTFEFAPTDATQPSFTGRFTNWFGGNIGANGQGFWSTFSLTGRGSDGSVIHFNGVMQFHFSNGEVHVEFTLENCRD